MGLPAEKHKMTLEDFLAWEAEQPERWEFFNGEAFMMAGGSDVHNAISLNTAFALRSAFGGTRCNVFMSDVRLRRAEDDNLFDPDVFVARQRITGDSGIDPDKPLELRVEFTKMGRDGTLVRIVQGPYDSGVAGYHSEGWEKELARLQTYLDQKGGRSQ